MWLIPLPQEQNTTWSAEQGKKKAVFLPVWQWKKKMCCGTVAGTMLILLCNGGKIS